jgi:organic hydroperoxide reductase OsmC/OhrA
MRITARVHNARDEHRVVVATDGKPQALTVAAKTSGQGSAVNGGEFLMLALATCYCNDLYREAARKGIAIDAVEVEAQADFAGVGVAASNVTYRARIVSTAAQADVDALLRETDAVAEVQNTLRIGRTVARQPWGAEQRGPD